MQGGFRFFRFRGIDVHVHWTWFLAAAFIIQNRMDTYSSPLWNIAEYLAVFCFVLLHEFGHVFACRQTGGQADRILLWPLGGIAYVNPPQRPGAQLWSIAAGPLVNVALVFVLKGVAILFRHTGWNLAYPEAFNFLASLWFINWILLVFNLLPVYPLDGGQIVRSLLWFWVGKARSLWIACLIGFAGGLAVGALAFLAGLPLTGFIAVYLLWINWGSFQNARTLLRLEKLPRHSRFRCPECQEAAPQGKLWKCPRCQAEFDLFASGGQCPDCGFAAAETSCVHCGRIHPLSAWIRN
jgi:Zn-dependent protease